MRNDIPRWCFITMTVFVFIGGAVCMFAFFPSVYAQKELPAFTVSDQVIMAVCDQRSDKIPQILRDVAAAVDQIQADGGKVTGQGILNAIQAALIPPPTDSERAQILDDMARTGERLGADDAVLQSVKAERDSQLAIVQEAKPVQVVNEEPIQP